MLSVQSIRNYLRKYFALNSGIVYLKKYIKNRIFGAEIFQPFFKTLFSISIQGMNIGTGGQHPRENGEFYVARYVISQIPSPIVFDVGAQGGDYIDEILTITKGSAKIYAFEPCTRDYESLLTRFKKKQL